MITIFHLLLINKIKIKNNLKNIKIIQMKKEKILEKKKKNH